MPLKAEVSHQLNNALGGSFGCFGARYLVGIEASMVSQNGAVLSLEFKHFVQRQAKYQVWRFLSGSGFGQARQILNRSVRPETLGAQYGLTLGIHARELGNHQAAHAPTGGAQLVPARGQIDGTQPPAVNREGVER